jgi:hypothetical protein
MEDALQTHPSRNEAKREKRSDEWPRPRILPQSLVLASRRFSARALTRDARRKRHGSADCSNCQAFPNSCDRSIYRAGEIQAIVRNCARRGFPMAKTFLLVSFSAPACGCVAFLAGLAVVAFGSSAQAQFGVPGAIPPFTMPEAAAGAITADCYYEWKGRGGRTYQCPTPAPAPPKKPETKK